MKHTPGAWTFVISSHQREWYGWIIGRNGSTVAAISKSKEKEEANARLIAAAPELLAACSRLLNACDYQTFNGGVTGEVLTVMEEARIAIAKAVSETPSDNPARPTLP